MAAFVAAAALTAGAAAYSSNQAGKAADAAASGADAATAEQRRQFDLGREDTAPWREVGQSALNQLAAMYGLGQAGEIDPATGVAASATAPDYSAFYESPDYQFALSEGQRGIERSAAARGGLASGNTLASLSKYNQGMASQQLGNYTNRLASLSNTGQTSAENLSSQRATLGQQVGQNYQNAANARASGITGAADAWGNAAGSIAGFAGYRWG